MACLKLKQLHSYLQDVDGFDNCKIHLEQYETTPELSASMLHEIESLYGDIGGSVVADFGCGTGRLAIGAALLGASHVVGFDIDKEALSICSKNIEDFELSETIDLVQADILRLDRLFVREDVSQNKTLLPLSCDNDEGFNKKDFAESRVMFDTVIMNPPFGTKDNIGIDMEFVRQALLVTSGSVYSLHKSASKKRIEQIARRWGIVTEGLAEMKFDIKYSYSYQRHDSVDVEVDLIRFSKNSGTNTSELEKCIGQLDDISLFRPQITAKQLKDKYRKHKRK